MVLWSWFAGCCAFVHCCGVHWWPFWAESVKQRGGHREKVPLFQPDFMIDGVFHWDSLGSFVTFPVLFSSPPSLSLLPQGSQLAFLSGCLLSGSAGSSNCALSRSFLASQVTHTVTSPPLLCSLQTPSTTRRDNKSQCTPLFTSQPPKCDSVSVKCWCSVAVDTQNRNQWSH